VTGTPEDRDFKRAYVERLLQIYRGLPGTLGLIRPVDRRLARQLYDERVPLVIVEAAFAVAVCRRVFRDGPALPAPRTLHYFLPVIREIQREPLEPGYEAYLRAKLARLQSTRT
jgi:hypothetical protein